MKRMFSILSALVLVGTLASIAGAQPVSPRIDRREARQHARIHQGWRNGQLTPREAHRLRAGQQRVRRMERHAKSDGVMTARERYRIQRTLDRQNHRIHRLRHNGRVV